MRSRGFNWLVLIVSLVVILGAILPFAFAASRSNEQFVFGGFLLNPTDGNSYLAKMFQGWRGERSFTLPYTSQPGSGAYLFLFYLALGHLARVANMPLLWIFHLARLISILLMMWALYRFCWAVLPEPRHRNLAFALGALGSGLGWLVLPFGGFTSDFWVAEAYPFLSAYANPHFPLGIALLLVILTPPLSHQDEPLLKLTGWLRKEWMLIPVSLALSAIAPFGVVVACTVLLGLWVWSVLEKRSALPGGFYLARLLWVVVGGLPLLAYAIWVTNVHPALRIWNQQNQTPSPPLWDLVVSLSPLLLLAILGGWRLFSLKREGLSNGWDSWRIPLVWAAMALILVYIPWNLQRRFLMGLFIPLSALAPPGLDWLAGGKTRRYWFLAALVFLLILPTNLIILMTARHAALTHDTAVYLYRDESKAFTWLNDHALAGSIVLAAPQTGLLIPAYTGLRVLYGHPFETVDAKREEGSASEAYAGTWDAAEFEAFLDERRVSYVFYGPRERSLGTLPNTPRLLPAFQQGEVLIYGVAPQEGSQ